MNIRLLFLILVFYFLNLNSQLVDCIAECDQAYQECSNICINKSKCSSNLAEDYVINSCMEDCPDIDIVKDCINECHKKRSDCYNCCINDFCLETSSRCPSCGMDF